MGYRGEDRSRDRETWGAQSPRQSSREHAGYDSSSYDSTNYDSASYGDSTAYNGTSSYEDTGYDGYAQGGDYQSDGYATGGFSTGRHGTGGHRAVGYGDDYDGAGSYSGASSYDSGASYDSGSGYDSGAGYDEYSSGGHRTGSFGTGSTSGYASGDHSDYGSGYSTGSHSAQGFQGAPFDGTSYRSSSSYDGASSYDSPTSYGNDSRSGYDSGTSGRGSGSGSYPALGHPSGPYPALGRPSGEYPALGHPSGPYPALGRSSGEYPVLQPDPYDDGNDWYARSGPIPAGGFADTSAQIAVRDPVRDPVRGYPPEPARPDPGLATTRQQQRYDESEFVTYPGYEGVDDGYNAQRGYGYDDYGDQTRLDQVAIGYDAPNGARGFGQALQGDNFDNGMYRDGYDDAGDELRGGPRTGPQRLGHDGAGKKSKNKKKQQKALAAQRSLAGQPKRSRLPLVLTLTGVVVVAAVGYGGYRVYVAKSKANNQEAAISQPLPTVVPSSATQQCAAQFGGPFCHIETRVNDPAPLTVSEVFPPSVFNEASKIGFSLAATNVDTDCTKAVYGTDLMKQLKAGQCNQALRGSYVSQDSTMMGTIGVFNLISTNQAHYAAKLIGAQDFMVPLSGKGVIAKLGNGTGVVETEYKGHYLIVTWSQFTSGKAPTTAQTQQLEGFDTALLASTANSYLSDRMVNGGPSVAPTPSGSTTPSATTKPSASSSTH